MKDIQVFTALDAKTVAAEKLDILLLSTEGAADMATYNDLEKLKAAFPRKKVAAMADKMFNQDNTLADTLIRKVRVAGIENPQNVGGTASRIEIAFGENMPTENAGSQHRLLCQNRRQGCGEDHDRRGSAGGLHRAGEAVRRNVL